ncbi:hypothetical protein C8R45DRAFT_1081604 [Mycena sanguinolenta]|nr:hypothetical protein C8R45DRAFT_1081604 [Mycena sanguinolenta]
MLVEVVAQLCENEALWDTVVDALVVSRGGVEYGLLDGMPSILCGAPWSRGRAWRLRFVWMRASPRCFRFRVAAGILDDDAEHSQLSTGADVLVACPIALPTLSRPCTAGVTPSLSHWYSQ